jgi:hypothetical protein
MMFNDKNHLMTHLSECVLGTPVSATSSELFDGFFGLPLGYIYHEKRGFLFYSLLYKEQFLAHRSRQ